MKLITILYNKFMFSGKFLLFISQSKIKMLFENIWINWHQHKSAKIKFINQNNSYISPCQHRSVCIKKKLYNTFLIQ